MAIRHSSDNSPYYLPYGKRRRIVSACKLKRRGCHTDLRAQEAVCENREFLAAGECWSSVDSSANERTRVPQNRCNSTHRTNWINKRASCQTESIRSRESGFDLPRADKINKCYKFRRKISTSIGLKPEYFYRRRVRGGQTMGLMTSQLGLVCWLNVDQYQVDAAARRGHWLGHAMYSSNGKAMNMLLHIRNPEYKVYCEQVSRILIWPQPLNNTATHNNLDY